jgi:putative acetyltransferase
MNISIEIAASPAQFEAGREIFTQYAGFLNLDLSFQGFTEEMASLSAVYGPPAGCLLLAQTVGGKCVGAVGLRKLETGVAEIKRMFVLPEYQGIGVGNALMEAFIPKAKELGYNSIKLDSIRSLDKALTLYRKFGFVEIESYRYNPFPDAVFMEWTDS